MKIVFRCLACLAMFLCSITAAANEALWSLLQRGGQVVLIRHAETVPGVGDPAGMTLADCTTQRNLSEEGRAQARELGQTLQRRRVPIGEVLSSPWCRCLETARLAFGNEPRVLAGLGNLFGRHEHEARQIAQLKPLASRKPATGNTIMVSHGSTILALTGVSPATGEMVVLTPSGSGFTVSGRLTAP